MPWNSIPRVYATDLLCLAAIAQSRWHLGKRTVRLRVRDTARDSPLPPQAQTALRIRRPVCARNIFFIFIATTCPAFAQSPAQVVPSLVRVAGAAFSHGNMFHTVVLTGIATRGEGIAAQSGNAKLIAHSDGSGSTQITAGSYSENEEYPTFSPSADCLKTLNNAPFKESYPRRCVASALWYLPQIAMLSASTDSTLMFDSLSTGDQGILLYRVSALPSPLSPTQLKARSSSTLKIDLASALITQNSFTISPVERPPLKIPIIVLYSDYVTNNGITIPSHIQRYVGGTLQIDIRITSVELS